VRRRAALALLAAGLVASGCSLFASAPGPKPAQIVAAPGEQFTLRLDTNRAAGFAWELAKPLDTSVVTLVGTAYEEAASGGVGAPGVEVWTFAAVASGWTTINLAYRRPWEEMAPARIIAYSVDVAP
jgi:predicted secreted protein